MNNVKYLIIGAGVTGLTFANYLASDDYLIIEKEKEAGGYCRSIYKDGFIWDYSGHFYHFNNELLKERFISDIGEDNLIIKEKNTKILYNNLLIDYPFQSNIHQLNKDEFIDCLYDIYHRDNKKHYNSFEEMLYGKYGRSITEKFLKPYNEKLYACSLKELDQKAMGRFFPDTDIKDIIENMKYKNDLSYNKQFYYPKYGSMIFIKSLLKRIDINNIIYDEEVVKIDIENKTVITNKGNIYKYHKLINTGPLKMFLNMLDKKESRDNILSYNNVLVYNLGFDTEPKDNNLHWLYIPSKKISFYRVGFYNSIQNLGKLSVYVEIASRKEERINAEDKLNDVLRELREIGVIDSANLASYSIIQMSPAYVHVATRSNAYVKRIKNILHKNDIFSIGRYGSWRYCSIEDSMIEAINAASEININI